MGPLKITHKEINNSKSTINKMENKALSMFYFLHR